MKKTVWFILILVIVGLIIGVFVYLYTFRKSDVSVASLKTDIEISVEDLLAKFMNNEDSANTAFLDKVIIVSGIIDKIAEDSASFSVYLKKTENISGVMCGFDKSTFDKTAFNLGDPIKVKGKCTGYLMDVVLNKCSVEK